MNSQVVCWCLILFVQHISCWKNDVSSAFTYGNEQQLIEEKSSIVRRSVNPIKCISKHRHKTLTRGEFFFI